MVGEERKFLMKLRTLYNILLWNQLNVFSFPIVAEITTLAFHQPWFTFKLQNVGEGSMLGNIIKHTHQLVLCSFHKYGK